MVEMKEKQNDPSIAKVVIAMLVSAISLYAIKAIIDSSETIVTKFVYGGGIYLITSAGLIYSGVLKSSEPYKITRGKLIAAYMFFVYFAILFGPYISSLFGQEESGNASILIFLPVPLGLINSILTKEKSKIIKTLGLLLGSLFIAAISLWLEPFSIGKHVVSYLIGSYLGYKLYNGFLDEPKKKQDNSEPL